jgi:hypothetical protein
MILRTKTSHLMTEDAADKLARCYVLCGLTTGNLTKGIKGAIQIWDSKETYPVPSCQRVLVGDVITCPTN